jgi:hypothetical protein
MTENTENIIGLSFFGLLIVSLLVDAYCASTWNKSYFTSGLMVYTKSIPVNYWHSNLPKTSLFEKAFHSEIVASLTFKEIDLFSYGFREKMVQFRFVRYTPIMHGLITFDTTNGQVTVKGYANWHALVFSFLWLGMLTLFTIGSWSYGNMRFSALIFIGALAFFSLVMGILYWIQSSRFSKVAQYAAQSWARKYVRE